MKLVIATYGTEGDTRPLAALGRALLDAGHDVRLLADAATLGSAAALGVPSAPLSGDIRRAIAPEGALADAVRGRVQSATGRTPGGPIRLLTHLRTRYHLNPVVFGYTMAFWGWPDRLIGRISQPAIDTAVSNGRMSAEEAT